MKYNESVVGKLPEIPGYRILDVLGVGGTSTVYRAMQLSLDREVALKVIAGASLEQRTRLVREAKLIAGLSHSGVPAVYDFKLSDNYFYMSQELVRGPVLSEILRDRNLPVEKKTWVLHQIAVVLEYAHSLGVVHRDVKPSNVALRENGSVVLLDFGIAKPTSADSSTTLEGEIMGTPLYMAPEALRGEEVDFRADVYSFGVVGFELLADKKPFEGGTVLEVIISTLQSEPPSLLALAPSCPKQLAELIEQCLAKSKDARPASMQEVAAILSNLPMQPLIAAGDIGATPGRALNNTAAIRFSATRQCARDIDDAIEPWATAVRQSDDFPSDDSPEGDLEGQVVGKFTLHERIARGHSGDLYKAWDPVRGCIVALKIVRANDKSARQRLLRGGRIWIKLDHPNIVRVFDVHPDYHGFGGVIVSEIVDALCLTDITRQRHLNLEQCVWIAMQLCDALSAIHGEGVVHREIKPKNILVRSDTLHVTLLDSGIARHENPEIDMFTKVGVFVGDLAYAAPEQISGRVDQRSDIYSVVAVLYELVTNSSLPFPLPKGWEPNESAMSNLPDRLRRIIARGLHYSPAARFDTAAELRDQLRFFAPNKNRPIVQQVVVALHGIRTLAAWQRAFAEVAAMFGLGAHIDRWNFGYFSAIRFLMPWARLARVRWFRETYQQEFRDSNAANSSLPSIVAHSFGTYILGNALLRYPYLRFDKVLLCGAILPPNFPWELILERGQVQAVRNEYGSEDFWTSLVGYFVPGTGPSGLSGFDAVHEKFEQERFDFAHSEYFERSHMKSRWLPFLTAKSAYRPASETTILPRPRFGRPWGLYALYFTLASSLILAIRLFT